MKELGILTQDEYQNQFRINNAAAFSNPASYGLEQTVTTLTQIIADVQRQKFYTVAEPLTSYVPIEMGTGAYSRQLFQYAVAQVGDNFEAGIIQPGNGINKDANLDITIDGISIKNHFWRMKYECTKEILESAKVNAQTFSYIEEQERARLKTAQLGLQKNTIIGISGVTTGLLNNPNVTINTSLLPVSLATMNITQLTNFAKTVMATYFANTNSTVYPNTLLMPTSDYMSLGVPINPEYPIGTIREFIERAFRDAGAPADFKILHTVYNNTASTSGAGRYVLYNRDPDTLTMYVPKPYTPYPLYPTGSLDMISDSEMQFTGVWIKRPKEVLYMDVTA